MRQARVLTILSLVAIATLALCSCNKAPAYATYEDCILEEITSSQTEAAVIAIHQACEAKFPEPPPTKEELQARQAAADAANAAAAETALELAKIQRESAALLAATKASADAAMAAADAAASTADGAEPD